jgi:hypothetical protein
VSFLRKRSTSNKNILKNMIKVIKRQLEFTRNQFFIKWKVLVKISKQADDFELELECRKEVKVSSHLPFSFWGRVSESLNLLLPACNPVIGCAFSGKIENKENLQETLFSSSSINDFTTSANGIIDVRSKKHNSDFNPIDNECTCYTCTRYTRSYLHHLFHADKNTCQHMIQLHNLHFTCRVIAHLAGEDKTLADKIRNLFPLVVEPSSRIIMHPPAWNDMDENIIKEEVAADWRYQNPLVTPGIPIGVIYRGSGGGPTSGGSRSSRRSGGSRRSGDSRSSGGSRRRSR